jgi:hypothetical protein
MIRRFCFSWGGKQRQRNKSGAEDTALQTQTTHPEETPQ